MALFTLPRLLRLPSIALGRLALIEQSTPLFSNLPNELVHIIFEKAASDSPESCRALCLVSSWARMLALTHYMPTIVIENVDVLDYFLDFPVSRPTPNWVHPLYYIRNLWISAFVMYQSKRDPKTFMPDIMERSPNISNMAVTGDGFLSLVESGVDVAWVRNDASLRLTILPGGGNPERDHRLFVSNAAKLSYNHPILSRVTHLTIHNMIRLPLDRAEVNVEIFPCLTHLAVSITCAHPAGDDIHKFLQSSLSLQTLQQVAVLCYDDALHRTVAEDRDKLSRVYVFEHPEDSDCMPDYWREELDNGEDWWTKAVEFTERVRKVLMDGRSPQDKDICL